MKNVPTNIQNLKSTQNIVFILLSLWMTYLLILGVLQLCGLPFGFMVWPMGEDLNWIGFMRQGPGMKMTQLFWQVNDRNPLSAWWWFLASPLIEHADWGIYCVRKCVDPFLAVTTFLLLNRLGRGQCRTFAFSIGLLVLMWNFNYYYEQIVWEFLVALCFTLLSIFFYCRYVDQERRSGSDLALAIICYFVAFTTYTLQSGAVIAIALLAFFRSAHTQNLKARLKHTIIDTSFFIILFILYDCIWYTVNRNAQLYYQIKWTTFFPRFIASIKQFICHATYKGFVKIILLEWSVWTVAGIFFTAFLSLYFLFSKLLSREVLDTKLKAPIGWGVAVLLAIAVPTVIIESTSSEWIPGYRSIMIQQVWQPLLYIGIIFFLTNFFLYKYSDKMQKVLFLAVSLLGAAVVTLNLNYNYHLVKRTFYEMALKKGLEELHCTRNHPLLST